MLHWTASSPSGETLVPMMISKGVFIDAVDNFGRTALHLLAALGRINGVTCLLHHGADVNIREHVNNLLAIDYASIHGHDDVVKVLMAYGAQPTEIPSYSSAMGGIRSESISEELGGSATNSQTTSKA